MNSRRYLDQRLRLQLLRVVDVIASQGSLLKASAALSVSQPALTRNLHELEDIVQSRLFDRHSRGVRATPAGEMLVTSARRVLAELRRLDEALDQIDQADAGLIALGALPVAASGIMPGVLTRLKLRHPDIQVRLQQGRTEELLPLLASGDLDLVVGRLYEPPTPDGFLRERLWFEPISVIARADHPIFSLPDVSPRDLRRFELVLPTVSQRVGQELDQLLSALSLASARSLRSSSYEFIREMLHTTDSISIMPRLMMMGELVRGTLRLVHLPISAPRRPAGLIFPADRPLAPPVQSFVTCLRGFLAEAAVPGTLEE